MAERDGTIELFPHGLNEDVGVLAEIPAPSTWGPVIGSEVESLAPIEDGYYLPRAFWGVFRDGPIKWDLRVEIRGGRLRIAGIRVTSDKSDPLGVPPDLRTDRLSPSKVVRILAALSARRLVPRGDELVVELIPSEEHDKFLRLLGRHERSMARSGFPPDEDVIKETADVYRKALADGKRPTKAVQEWFGVERWQASRWVRKARDAGYLEETNERKAGG